MVAPELLNHIPEITSLVGTLTIVMALSKPQRLAIIDLYDGRSALRKYSEELGFHQEGCVGCVICQGQGCGLQVHHIETQRTGGLDIPTNLVPLNTCEHVGKYPDGTFADLATTFVVHPDMVQTFQEYRDGNKNAFTEMMEVRNAIIADGGIYHNDIHDAEFKETAQLTVMNAIVGGWTFPESEHNNPEPESKPWWKGLFD